MPTIAPYEELGPFRLYPPIPESTKTGWTLSWNGEWLPGSYAERDAVLLVCGLFMGNQNNGLVDEFMEMLTEYYNRAVPSRDITVNLVLKHWLPNFSG